MESEGARITELYYVAWRRNAKTVAASSSSALDYGHGPKFHRLVADAGRVARVHHVGDVLVGLGRLLIGPAVHLESH